MTNHNLTPKQQRFVDEYLIDMNATQAYIRAGYTARGNAAEVNAIRLLRNAQVAALVDEGRKAISERTELTQEQVVTELAKIGFSDVRKLFDENGALIPIHMLSDEAAACLSSFEVVTRRPPGGGEGEVEHVVKVKLWDKPSALVNLGKHLGGFNDKSTVNHQHLHLHQRTPEESRNMLEDRLREALAKVAKTIEHKEGDDDKMD